eukprot:5457830-Prymnesium_polylepis.1
MITRPAAIMPTMTPYACRSACISCVSSSSRFSQMTSDGSGAERATTSGASAARAHARGGQGCSAHRWRAAGGGVDRDVRARHDANHMDMDVGTDTDADAEVGIWSWACCKWPAHVHTARAWAARAAA